MSDATNKRDDREVAEPTEATGVLPTDPRMILNVLYAALALGVAVLVIVFYALGPVAESSVDRRLFRWVWLPAAVACTVGAGVVRGRALAVSRDARSVLPSAIVVWSLAEGQALLAAIGFFLTGDLMLLVAGLVLFVFLLGRHRPGAFLDRP